MIGDEVIEKANGIVAYYTLAAAATGAVPVPAASGAIIAENGFMLTHIASALSVKVSIATVVESLGIAGTLNIVGRNLFIEGAKLLSWGTGSIWALAALAAFGATTAGVQTYIIGRMAIEIGKNGGKPLLPEFSGRIIEDCKKTYDSFVSDWKKHPPRKPD
jgi:hypothetical protein